MDLKTISTHIASARFNMGQLQAINMEPFRIRSHDLHLREFFKTPVILIPGALLVGCLPQFVFHFAGIRWIRRIREIRARAQKTIFARSEEQPRGRAPL